MEQNMRIKSMKTENKQLRQQLVDQASLWSKLQHDLLMVNGLPETKGRRQQVHALTHPPTPSLTHSLTHFRLCKRARQC